MKDDNEEKANNFIEKYPVDTRRYCDSPFENRKVVTSVNPFLYSEQCS